MIRMLPRATVLVSFIGLIGPGCGGGKGPAESKPTDALRSMTGAIQKGDRAAFLDSWRSENELRELLGILFDSLQASLALKADVEKAYGAEGWEKMQSRGGMDAAMSFEAIGEKIDTAHCKVEGDGATCTFPGDPQPLPLVREGGRWRIDGETLFPPGQARGEMRASLAAVGKAITRIRSEVGKPGATPESLGDLLKAEVEKAGKG